MLNEPYADDVFSFDQQAAWADIGRREERERCAKIAEEAHWDGHSDGIAGRKIAARIRNGTEPLLGCDPPQAETRFKSERERCAKIVQNVRPGVPRSRIVELIHDGNHNPPDEVIR